VINYSRINPMSKKIYLAVILTSVLMIVGCEKDDEVIKISLIENGWTQSSEEKASEEIEVYRPKGYKDFPASRYRQIFNFYSNNVCEYLVLSANDSHYMESGSWEYANKTTIIKIFNSDFRMVYQFEVLELSNNLLKMKTKK